ncbi:MAG: bile acid:sodium symporter family protein [Gammaproteobacteria bacterium]|nr:bile acid:sodium symporter family protein [Gammaproteobacteria bacterium]
MELAFAFQTIIIPFGLFLIMMGLGLTLSIDDILRVIIMPKAVLIGLTGQLLLLPVIAFGIAFLLNPAPVIAIGLILLAACPGGITSNAYVFASRGDIALSVTLTSIASLFTVVTMPLLAWMALTAFTDSGEIVDVPIANMMRSLAQLTILPIILGMLTRKFKPDFAQKMVEPVRKMAIGILIMVIVANTWFSIDTLKMYFVQAGMAALVLNLTCMSVGFGLSRFAKLNINQTISITYEVGIQNLSLALVLANTLLMVPDYAAVTLVYGFIMKFTALSFMAYARKLKGLDKAEAATA